MNLQEIKNSLRRRVPFDEIPSKIDEVVEFYQPKYFDNAGDFISEVCDTLVNEFNFNQHDSFSPKEKDELYFYLVDTYGEYIANIYHREKQTEDNKMLEQISRINDMMGVIAEDIPSAKLRRRVKTNDIDRLVRKYKSIYFRKDEPVEKSIDGVINRVVDEMIPYSLHDEVSDQELNNLSDYLKDYLYGIYKDELTKYYENRQAERDKEEDEGIIYIFHKHDRPYYDRKLGSGFSESFYGFDDLLTKYGHWLDIDWDEVKRKLDDINEYPNKKYDGNYSEPLRISSIGDEGNDWGYNFSILKKKQREY